jgi:CHAT domain-containing protein
VVFHRELAATRNPIQALRAAQLALLRSGDAALASPLDWGAFVAIGTAAP